MTRQTVMDVITAKRNATAGLLISRRIKESPRYQAHQGRTRGQIEHHRHWILKAIHAAAVGTTTTQIAIVVGLSHTRTWQLLRDMEAEGLIRNASTAHNSRQWIAYLNPPCAPAGPP